MVQAAQIAGDSADLTWDPGVQVMRGPGPPRLQDVTEARLVVIEKKHIKHIRKIMKNLSSRCNPRASPRFGTNYSDRTSI